MFETFSVPAFYMVPQEVTALYASGRTSGIVLNVGATSINCIPIYEGHIIAHACKTINFGMRDIIDHLMKILTERGYSFTTTAEREIVKDIMHKLCYVASDFEMEMQRSAESSTLEKSYELPDGQVITIGNERFRAPEGLFSPAFLNREDMGIHELLASVIRSVDSESGFPNSIVLCGGGSMLPGLTERLSEVVPLVGPLLVIGLTITLISLTLTENEIYCRRAKIFQLDWRFYPRVIIHFSNDVDKQRGI